MLTPGRAGPSQAGPVVPSVAWTVSRFAIAGLAVLVGILIATTQLSRDLGERQALDEARRVARLTGVGVVQPHIDADLLAGDPAALQELNEAVRDAVIAGSLVRVKLWTPDGRIVYSDEARLIGEIYPFAADRAQALRTGAVVAEISDLASPENRFERSAGDLLEVYVPLEADLGRPLLYAAYFEVDGVREAGRRTWLAFVPVTIGALLLLQIVQIPLAWALARRVRHDALARQVLLQRAVDASDLERRRIAADLHDGVVQDLTGISYSLSAAAGADVDGVVATSARGLRDAVRQLRSSLVDIYPPDLVTEGLGAALEDLVARVRSPGTDVVLDVPRDVDVPAEQAALLHRVAQEGLRNIARHARASRVVVTVDRVDGGVRLRIDDDGVGMDVDEIDRRAEGHLGMRLLRDVAAQAGGRLVLRSAPGHGTELELWVPLP